MRLLLVALLLVLSLACGSSDFAADVLGKSDSAQENKIPRDTDKPSDNGEGVPGYLVDPSLIKFAESGPVVTIEGQVGSVTPNTRLIVWRTTAQGLATANSGSTDVEAVAVAELEADENGGFAPTVFAHEGLPHVLSIATGNNLVFRAPTTTGTRQGFWFPGRNDGMIQIRSFPVRFLVAEPTTYATQGPIPILRSEHASTQGKEWLLYFGGRNQNGEIDQGGLYNFQTRTWQPVSNGVAGSNQTATWADSEFIVWGGTRFGGYMNAGARLDPTTRSWTPTTFNGAPSARRGHSAIWLDNELFIWGGDGGASGRRYSPSTNEWLPMGNADADQAVQSQRQFHGATIFGREMIVFGGSDPTDSVLPLAGRYDLTKNIWHKEDTSVNEFAGRRFFLGPSPQDITVVGLPISESAGVLFGTFSPTTGLYQSLPLQGLIGSFTNNTGVVWLEGVPLIVRVDGTEISVWHFNRQTRVWSTVGTTQLDMEINLLGVGFHQGVIHAVVRDSSGTGYVSEFRIVGRSE